MAGDSHDQWHTLEREATVALTRAAVRDDLQVQCHCVFLPAFEDCRAYTALLPLPKSSLRPLGVRRIWRRKTDLARFDPAIRLRYGLKLEPTIEENEVALEQTVIDAL